MGDLVRRRTPDSDSLKERRQAARRILVDFVDVRRGGRVWIFTDPGRRWFAEHLLDAALELGCRASLTCLQGDSAGELSAGDLSTADLSAGAVSRVGLSTRDLSTAELSTGAMSSGDLSTPGPSAGDQTTGDLSTGNLSTAELSAGAVSTGDLSTPGLSAGDRTTGDLSTRDLSTADLSAGAVSTGDLSTPDLSAGVLSTGELDAVRQLVRSLEPEDTVVSAFSDYSMGKIPFFTVFPNFRPPEGFPGKSAVIRAHYPDEALVQHLLTSLESVDAVANRYLALADGGRVRVASEGGTEIECEVGKPILLPYKIGAGSRHAFLPPAEIAFGITAGTAEGMLVVDLTAGDIVVDGKTVLRLGLVDRPIHVELKDGRVTTVSGGRTAEILWYWLERLGPAGRLAVELGFGLSAGTPTGHGSADECLQGTFHVGFGDDSFFNKMNKAPVHLDLICRGPQVTRLPAGV